ncbi:hypothetical protein F5Y15DRAFT_401550 [Xylariaceae sp. FL0016]|nr:hypothetical protein F5Y15DRAFT_401550 [Xylariaceae sp. FL0016]
METTAASEHVGPRIGALKVGRQYIYELTIRRKLANVGGDVARETSYRLQGIQLIDEVRNHLQLPIMTFDAACTFYHRFRLKFPGNEYYWQDVALACLWVACKAEDTLKKSRDILCANHNIKNPDNLKNADDKIFETPQKVLIGLERIVMETIRFNYRIRYPQEILAKLVKKILGRGQNAKNFFNVAWKMSIDMYKTFVPLKQTTFTCAVMLAQLTALVTGRYRNEFMSLNYTRWHTEEAFVAEVMLDVLELYTHHPKETMLGVEIDNHVFIEVKIQMNQKFDSAGIPRYQNQCSVCERDLKPPTPSDDGSNVSPSSPTGTNSTIKRGLKGHDGTMRFHFDAAEARQERETYQEYVKEEWEEWEEEVEEPIPEPRPEPRPPREPRGGRGHRGHGPRGGWRGGRGDRRRGRGGY